MELKRPWLRQRLVRSALLIVLNGIETNAAENARKDRELLIVLNGIETVQDELYEENGKTFNRTKWN